MTLNDLAFLKSAISNSSCDFYIDLENISPCGSQGYVQKFIYKYCMAYLNQQDSFINQAWLNGIRVCLQQNMLNYLENNLLASCPEIKKHGFDSHTDCYLNPDPSNPEVTFCRLPPQDMTRVVWIARSAVFEPAVWSQFGQLITHCATQIFQG
ncbi:unnamed protein product [Rotaria magnacalcarata]|uniref:Uncharacterized protein n=2 Tax=Rotaria magnacalcarata TaxID=392030 RepID=A0A816VDQ7_9BILA|nr:unnamed protein product [Rotaria magnacalcarata]